MWFGTGTGGDLFKAKGGVSRYDGNQVQNLTEADGLLPGNVIRHIYQDGDGVLWFSAFRGGLSRYDGKQFSCLTTKDGLLTNSIFGLCRDRDGVMWIGTNIGVVSRYDGKQFHHFTKEDGLLGEILKVEFERSEPEETGTEAKEIPDISLPEELLERLKKAAESHKVTELKAHLNEVEELGSEGQKLAQWLHELIRNYDLEGVVKILSEIRS
jgi:hypothetical protein